MGDSIVERYIDYDGKEKIREVKYRPTLFLHTNANTGYRDIYGKFCQPYTFNSIKEANRWKYGPEVKDKEIMGMDNYLLAYLSDQYEEDIEYDMSKIRIAIFDIEVTTDGPFPNEYEAKYAIDAVSIYDTLDDKIYMFDLIEDKEHGLPRVKPWVPDERDLDKEVLDKVVYKTFTNGDDLLMALVDYVRQKMPTILAGWNSDKFDIPYIINRLKRRFGEEYAKQFSPYNDIYERTSYDAYEKPYKTYIPKGIAHMDYMEIYKAFRFKTQPSYSLDYIGKEETGIGKVDYMGPIHTLRSGNYIPTFKPEYDENDNLGQWLYIKYMINDFLDRKVFTKSLLPKINTLLESENIAEQAMKLIKVVDYVSENEEALEGADLELLRDIRAKVYQIYSDESHRKYITYSIMDVNLIKLIDDNLSYFELVFDLAYYAKMPISNVMSKIQIWDAIIFNSLKRDKRVVPMKDVPEHNERIVGAFVKDPIVGVHKFVLSFDLTSLKYMGL